MSFPDRHFQSACNINDIIRIGSLLACWLLLLKKLSPCVTYTEGIPDRISTLRIHSVYVHEVTDSATMDDGPGLESTSTSCDYSLLLPFGGCTESKKGETNTQVGEYSRMQRRTQEK